MTRKIGKTTLKNAMTTPKLCATSPSPKASTLVSETPAPSACHSTRTPAKSGKEGRHRRGSVFAKGVFPVSAPKHVCQTWSVSFTYVSSNDHICPPSLEITRTHSPYHNDLP